MIITATGLVAIENIQPGDMVLAANEEAGEVAYKEVVRTFVNTTDEITHVTVNVGDGVLETIDSTPEHPFYVEGKGWVEASSLHAGMTIWFANGTKGTVEDITNEGLESRSLSTTLRLRISIPTLLVSVVYMFIMLVILMVLSEMVPI